MKILIATDMEGITGVTTWDQVTPGHAEYARFRKLMTEDVNAAHPRRLRCGRGARSLLPMDIGMARISWSRSLIHAPG